MVFVDADSPVPVRATTGKISYLTVDRRVNSTPFAPRSRDLLGRALFRMASGGDALHIDATQEQLLGVVMGLCGASGIPIASSVEWEFDGALAVAIREKLPDSASMPELRVAASKFAATADSFDPRRLRHAMLMGEDRSGVVSSADPRPALVHLMESAEDSITSPRSTALLGYLLSDDHLGLRRSLGYVVALELDDMDLEEVPE
jgi:hypothetical protein